MKKLSKKGINLLKSNKLLVQNFSYLSLIHVFNMLVPLFAYPYLIRVLGNETYGLIVFAQAIVGYFIVIIGFGFNISATKEISVNRDNKEKLSEIASSVIILKGALLFISMLVFAVIIQFIDQAAPYKILFLFTFILCFSEWLMPLWFFMGIEKMKYITLLNVVSQSIFLILVFVVIKSKSDYLFYPLILGVGGITSGLIGLYIVFKKHEIRFVFPKTSALKARLVDSVPIFSSNLSLKMYLGSNKVIIGSFLSMQEVAFYDLGEKFLNLLKIPITIISQVLFPKMANNFNKELLLKLIKIIAFGTILLTVILEFISIYIIELFAGKEMIGAVGAVNILLLSVTPLVISNLLGVQTLLACGYNKQFFKVVFSALCVYVLYIVFCYYLNMLNLYTICISYLLVEVYMLIHFYMIIRKLKILK